MQQKIRSSRVTKFIAVIFAVIFICSFMNIESVVAKAPKYRVGSRVDVDGNTAVTAKGVNVRTRPSLNSPVIVSHRQKKQGTVVAGPQVADGYLWWKINYDNGSTGWSADNYIAPTEPTISVAPIAPVSPSSAVAPVLSSAASTPTAPVTSAVLGAKTIVSSGKFVIGDRVYVTVASLALKSTYSTRGRNIAYESKDAQGLVVEGPKSANGYIWYKVNFDNGFSGWAADKYLELALTTGTPPDVTPPPVVTAPLLWGAYVGDGVNDLANFENLVGKKTNLYADFEGWSNSFPMHLSPNVGQAGKTLIIFWEPAFGYDSINNGSQDAYIRQFAADAKTYGYPVILVPFDEMNLNEEAWGYGINNNTATKYKSAMIRIHDLFAGATNVKIGIGYNNVSVPNMAGNAFADYYPGDAYIDYVGVDGFNFANPWQTFGEVFDTAMRQVATFNKPVFIFSTASEAGSGKAGWITEGLGTRVKTYANIAGWVWFNQGGSPNWIVNSDSASLAAFKAILP